MSMGDEDKMKAEKVIVKLGAEAGKCSAYPR